MTRRGRPADVVLALALLLAVGSAAEPEAPEEAEAPPALTRTSQSGPVRAALRLQPAEPVIGDRLVLELEVTADPHVELLMPEFGEALDRFRIVDFAPSEGIDDAGRTVVTQRYTLQASRSGAQSVPPLRVEFIDRRPGRAPTPDDADAYELLTERMAFEVTSVLPADAPLELRPPKGTLGARPVPGAPAWPWILGAAVLLAAAAPFALRALARERARRARRDAYEVAHGELEALLYGPAPDAASMDRFYVELSGIVRRYVEDRFALRSPELTTDEFLDALADSPELLRSQRQLLQTFLRSADLVKFAHFVPATSDVDASVASVRRFLEATRPDGGGDTAAPSPAASQAAPS